MLAITDIPFGTTTTFDETLRAFQEHARAIASGKAEGDKFTWFLAAEYQWEMEVACEWLVASPSSRLSEEEKATLRHFLASMPEIRNALRVARRAAADRNERTASPEWTDWLEIAALPSWNNFTVRTAILLSQLGNPAQNDTSFFARH